MPAAIDLDTGWSERAVQITSLAGGIGFPHAELALRIRRTRRQKRRRTTAPAGATTLVRTALMHGRDPEAWLTSILERIVRGEVRTTEIDTLLPWNPEPDTRDAA